MRRRDGAEIAAMYARFGLLPIGGGDGAADGAGDGPADGAPDERETDAAVTMSTTPSGSTEQVIERAFEPITSQEELDRRISGRLSRQEQTLRKTIRDEITKELRAEAEQRATTEEGEFKTLYETSLADIAALREQLAAKEGEIKSRDRAALVERIAKRHNLPAEMAGRLQGETEDELNADAKALARVVGKAPPVETEGGRGRNQPKRTRTPQNMHQYGANLPIVAFSGGQSTPEG